MVFSHFAANHAQTAREIANRLPFSFFKVATVYQCSFMKTQQMQESTIQEFTPIESYTKTPFRRPKVAKSSRIAFKSQC